MALNLTMPEKKADLKPRIIVLGVGGAGGNAVNTMITSELAGVDFAVANTDAQALSQSLAEQKIQLGTSATQGLGAGSKPEIGAVAAEESLTDILSVVEGANMVFIAAGMGGGTGTGAAPVIAKAIKDLGILTVGVVTKPFHFEGQHRMRLADAGMEELQANVDTLITIPNQNLFRVANERTTFADAFRLADDVLYQGIRSISDLMVQPGQINLDFADVRALMSVMGKAMMGNGEGEGECRAIEAAEAAIANPLLEETSMRGAKGVLINIAGGPDLTLFEVDEAANRIREEVDPDANIIFGSSFDPVLQGRVRVSVVATGIAGGAVALNAPNRQSRAAAPAAPKTVQTAPAPAPVLNQPAAPAGQMPKPAPMPAPAPMPEAAPVATTTPVQMPLPVPEPAPVQRQAAPEPAMQAAPAFEPYAEGSPQPDLGDYDFPSFDDYVDETAYAAVPDAAPQHVAPAPEAAAPAPMMSAPMPPVAPAPQPQAPEQRTGHLRSIAGGASAPRGNSLFRRIQDFARGTSGAPAAAGAATFRSAPAPQQEPSLMPQAMSPAPAPAPQPRPVQDHAPQMQQPFAPAPEMHAPQPMAAPQMPQVSTPEPRIMQEPVQREFDEDLLEIPAFLRRQAN